MDAEEGGRGVDRQNEQQISKGGGGGGKKFTAATVVLDVLPQHCPNLFLSFLSSSGFLGAPVFFSFFFFDMA